MEYDKATFPDGPGLRFLNRTERWFGAGYCAICGDSGDALVARAVRYWCPDDGWRMGVLCLHCLDDARVRGPRDTDYAVATKARDNADRIDVTAAFSDLDDAAAEGGAP